MAFWKSAIGPIDPVESKPETIDPISDRQPVAETLTHLYAILTRLEVLEKRFIDSTLNDECPKSNQD